MALRETQLATAREALAQAGIGAGDIAWIVKWILDHVDGARNAAGPGELAFGTVDSWLLWRLTRVEVHATDASNAARTLVLDVHTNRWDDYLRAVRKPSIHPENRQRLAALAAFNQACKLTQLPCPS